MNREVAIRPEYRRVEVTYKGPISFRDRAEALEVLRDSMLELNLTRVLLDYSRAWGTPVGEVSLEEFCARLSAEKQLVGARVAFVNGPELHTTPTEIVGRKVGFLVRRFYDRASALDWLDAPEETDSRT